MQQDGETDSGSDDTILKNPVLSALAAIGLLALLGSLVGATTIGSDHVTTDTFNTTGTTISFNDNLTLNDNSLTGVNLAEVGSIDASTVNQVLYVDAGNTSDVQTTIDQCTGRCKVVIPPGDYYINDGDIRENIYQSYDGYVKARDNLTIDGSGATFYWNATTGDTFDAGFLIANVTDVRLQNLNIVNHQDSNNKSRAVRIMDSSKVELAHSTVEKWKTIGVALNTRWHDLEHISVHDNVVSGQGVNDIIGGGPQFGSKNVRSIQVVNNRVIHHGGDYTGGIALQGANDTTFADNVVHGSIYLAIEGESHHNVIANNVVRPPKDRSSTKIDVDNKNNSDVRITGNSVWNGYIESKGSSTGISDNNIVTALDENHLIQVTGNSSLITGNQLIAENASTVTDGIVIDGENVTATSNTLTTRTGGHFTTGINHKSGDNVFVENNYVGGSHGTAYSIDRTSGRAFNNYPGDLQSSVALDMQGNELRGVTDLKLEDGGGTDRNVLTYDGGSTAIFQNPRGSPDAQIQIGNWGGPIEMQVDDGTGSLRSKLRINNGASSDIEIENATLNLKDNNIDRVGNITSTQMHNLTQTGGNLPTCDSGLSGAVMYNSSGHWGCHSSSWNPMY